MVQFQTLFLIFHDYYYNKLYLNLGSHVKCVIVHTYHLPTHGHSIIVVTHMEYIRNSSINFKSVVLITLHGGSDALPR